MSKTITTTMKDAPPSFNEGFEFMEKIFQNAGLADVFDARREDPYWMQGAMKSLIGWGAAAGASLAVVHGVEPELIDRAIEQHKKTSMDIFFNVAKKNGS